MKFINSNKNFAYSSMVRINNDIREVIESAPERLVPIPYPITDGLAGWFSPEMSSPVTTTATVNGTVVAENYQGVPELPNIAAQMTASDLSSDLLSPMVAPENYPEIVTVPNQSGNQIKSLKTFASNKAYMKFNSNDSSLTGTFTWQIIVDLHGYRPVLYGGIFQFSPSGTSVTRKVNRTTYNIYNVDSSVWQENHAIITFVSDGLTMDTWVNNTKIDSGLSEIVNDLVQTNIGGASYTSEDQFLRFAESVFWRRALSDAEIETEYNRLRNYHGLE